MHLPAAAELLVKGVMLFTVATTSLCAQPAVRARTPSSHDPAPPAYTDSAHVMNGCYLSAVAYLLRFQAAFAAERGLTVVVHSPRHEGPHTIAAVTWQGEWWARDEHFGVFPLHLKARAGEIPDALAKVATAELTATITEALATGGCDPDAIIRQIPLSARDAEVEAAAALLPLASERFVVCSHGQDIALLFFRPAPDKVALYAPQFGSAVATCLPADSLPVARALVTLFGLPSQAVRRLPTRPDIPLNPAQSLAMR